MKSINRNTKHLIKCNQRTCITVLSVVVCFVVASCKKLVDVSAPITSLTAQNVYTNDATAASVLTGLYASMANGQPYIGSNGISLRTGLSADELTLWTGGFNGGDQQQLYQNNLSAQLPLSISPWQNFYKMLLTVNSAIEGLQASTSLTPAVKNHLMGEAKFLRAFAHFYLINFYGDVPLTVTSDWRVNVEARRTSKESVYQQIITDLKDAQSLLDDNYLQADALTPYSGSIQRIRPNKGAATAFLARAYLYMKQWSNAESEASKILDNTSLYSLKSLDGAFGNSSAEAIWQLQYTNTGNNTEAYHFILTSTPNNNQPTFLSNFLLNSFETGDDRKNKWVGTFTSGTTTYYYPKKYKAPSNPNNSEYFMVLRLAEQFLIRAEARARQNKLSEAISDLDKIRARALLPLIAITNPGISQGSLLDTIFHERQIELFTEWGHRWFDLKRTGKIDSVMSLVYPTKMPGGVWNTNWQLYPLSQTDIDLNPNLAPNNPGY